MSYRLAMDIGGTFTDFVVIDDDRLVLNDAPGGEGRHRGGRGIILDNRVRADNTRLACSYSRLKFPPRGFEAQRMEHPISSRSSENRDSEKCTRSSRNCDWTKET